MNVMDLGPNDWVTCPFDPVHRMKFSRFYNHFVECKKKHPEDRRKQCPYNFSELIEPECYDNHLSECPYQSLYFNMGQFTDLPEYDAPSHFDIGTEGDQRPLRSTYNRGLNTCSDSDEEFDSVSVALSGGFRRYYSRVQSLPQIQPAQSEPPQEPVIVASGSEKCTEKRGMGRGAWIRQMMEEKKSALRISDSVRSDESAATGANSLSDFWSNDIDGIFESFRMDPFRITKEFGKGRGAIFQTLIRD